jgi:hypothetical protein
MEPRPPAAPSDRLSPPAPPALSRLPAINAPISITANSQQKQGRPLRGGTYRPRLENRRHTQARDTLAEDRLVGPLPRSGVAPAVSFKLAEGPIHPWSQRRSARSSALQQNLKLLVRD